jgi:hypothetical protein
MFAEKHLRHTRRVILNHESIRQPDTTHHKAMNGLVKSHPPILRLPVAS